MKKFIISIIKYKILKYTYKLNIKCKLHLKIYTSSEMKLVTKVLQNNLKTKYYNNNNGVLKHVMTTFILQLQNRKTDKKLQ